MTKIGESLHNHNVICVFERGTLDDNWKGELLQIFEDPKDALKYIEDNDQDNMMFWEQWQITKRRDSNE